MDPLGYSTYIPNNPQYECNWTNNNNNNSNQVGILQQQQQQQQQQDDLTSSSASCWTTADEMGSFALPLDLEPLPSLFPFSPCPNGNGTTYKPDPCLNHQPFIIRENKQPSEVADVLLSLKHAVVHPNQEAKCENQHGYHHHQVLLSPNGSSYTSGSLCDQPFVGQQQSMVPTASPAAIFPSMSVNVSMNMTMHGYHHPAGSYPSTEISYPHQVQWNASTPQGAAPVSYQTQGLLSPSYGGATYSFTADFRPPPSQQPVQQEHNPLAAGYKPMTFSTATTTTAPRRRHSLGIFDDETQKPNVCRICGKSYARPSTLKTHLRTHSGEKPYRCIDCNKSFSQAANLTAHVRTHSGEKPFRCPVCDRRFSQSSSVTTHMRTHSGERPYRCRLCKKAFSDSSTLTKHLRIHSGEKPYECKLCLLRFSQSGNLNRHMRVHGTNGLIPP